MINTRERVIDVNFSRKARQLMKLAAIGIQILKSKVFRARIPIVVSIHVTNKCNLRCKYCYANIGGRFAHPPVDFGTTDLKRYITDMKRLGTRWIILLGGEPLLRNDIGELIQHVNDLGMLCELVTNGTLIEEKIGEIDGVDLLCISIDGDAESNDLVRGTGSFHKALRGLFVATSRGIKTRIHAVFTRYNTNPRDLNRLASIARRAGATFGFSHPITTDQAPANCGEYVADARSIGSFIHVIKQSKARGEPVYNSNAALDFASAKPSTALLVKRGSKGNRIPIIQKTCFAGDRFCYVDSEGFVYPCIEAGVRTGSNMREVGFKNAFAALRGFECKGCNNIQYFEANDILDLKLTGLMLGIKTLLGGTG